MSAPTSRFRDGRDFILNAPTSVPALWGSGPEVLWAAGEPLAICGPQGVGKTTVEQQLALKRAGIGSPDFLGFPVTPAEGKVLYIAADRPRQIARSFRRMVTEADAQALGDRLIVWEGPLPFELVKHPEALAEWVLAADVVDVYIDSLKDIMSPLSSDEVGSAYNRAVGGVIAAGIEVAVVHHQRKANTENRKPTSLADVYGSVWITAGAGSVILLWGQPGDPLVELTHLKQPAEQVGPLDLEHDHDHGHTTRRERPDAWTLLHGATNGGITAKDAAAVIYAAPTKADIEKVRRRFDRFVTDGHAVMIPATQVTEPSVYRTIARNSSVSDREQEREQRTPRSRALTRNPESPANTGPERSRFRSRSLTHDTPLTSPLKEWGERERPGSTPTDLDHDPYWNDNTDYDADPDDDPGRLGDLDNAVERERQSLGYGTTT
jgi:AAA domain